MVRRRWKGRRRRRCGELVEAPVDVSLAVVERQDGERGATQHALQRGHVRGLSTSPSNSRSDWRRRSCCNCHRRYCVRR